ncbi:alpha/beta-hydrolase [Cucurbitaria berberidis CBS 394.84]|uniref:Alpha/beta-hydrolase n=1 Tax=Cucurbitaria berberidis CBS 394.84 TaxID=1168544 RepID=A0A9P4GB38_9PLEO|nr:alpha/beta-hydrolase [Cucurbitaria berberidis CBS 394.84]KAF1842357.1 alpha/beta-hydrolase [Cucurbitaria berberidis CBS 394.84]
MPALQRIFVKAYWSLAGVGIAWATFVLLLINPTIQRHALYSHKLNTNFWHNVSTPEAFGFAKGQVQPFWLDTADGEKLFCWHVLPLDVYLQNEYELVKAATTGEVFEELKGTVGEKLMRRDGDSRVVVNFHGNAGHIAQGWRPSTYRSISGIPNTHLLTCDYRGYGQSTLKNAPHTPTETGLITDAISLLSYIQSDLKHPSTRTVLLGQSLGTAVTAATALYFADPTSSDLPTDIVHPKPHAQSKKFEGFAGIVLVAPFRDLPSLLKTYKIAGFFPILRPLLGYPRILDWVSTKIVDTWPTQFRLQALLSHSLVTPHQSLHMTLLHARNDGDISFRESEALFEPLQSLMLAEEGASATEERRSIHGGERVRRGAFAYKKVEDARGERVVELEVVRFGGHNEVVGWTQVSLAIRRAFERKSLRPGLDVE